MIASPPSEHTGIDPSLNCAEILKVLADETRLTVVRKLMNGPAHVGTLQRALDIEQSLLSHHLRHLRHAGVVEAERDGKAVLYRLSAPVESRRKGNVLNLGCCRLTFD